MKLITSLLLSASLLTPVACFSESVDKKCTDVEMSQVNYYFVSNLPKDKKIGSLYKEKIEELQSFSKKYQLKSFKILSHDVSLNANNYVQDSYELSMSISFESEFDYDLMDNLLESLQVSSISSSRMVNSVCNDTK